MHRRLLLLLLVAGLAGTGAAAVGAAKKDGAHRAKAHGEASSVFACPVPEKLRAAFNAASADTGLPVALLVAVGKVESNFEASARSEAGARGPLQLMPATGRELGLNIDDPSENILAGARYLKLLFSRFNSTDLALAAYNAGPTAVERAGGAPTGGTLTYVANVTRLWSKLRNCE
jgi:soluble lytic murein transglycosylase-like protein